MGYNRNNEVLSLIQDQAQLTEQENKLIAEFYELCEKHAQSYGINPDVDGYDINKITESMNISLYEYHKEGIFVLAVWVTYLQILKKYMHPDNNMFKYQRIDQFHQAYHGIYMDNEVLEQQLLWETANWMAVLFNLIPARKNKGLAMQIIPKVVEGWQAKYVTGSGQTKATADRVHIFEVEGGITINHRTGRMKPKKHTYNSNQHHEGTVTAKTTKRRMMSDHVMSSSSSDASSETSSLSKRRRSTESTRSSATIPTMIYENPINASKYLSHVAHMRAADSNNHDHDEATDNDDDSDMDEAEKKSSPKTAGPSKVELLQPVTVFQFAPYEKTSSTATAIAPMQSMPSVLNKDEIGNFQLFRSSSLEQDSMPPPPAMQRNISMSKRLGLSTSSPVVVTDHFLHTFDYLDNAHVGRPSSAAAPVSAVNAVNSDDLFMNDMEWFELLAICQ